MIKFKYTDCSNDSNLFEIIFGLKKRLLFISREFSVGNLSWERNITTDHEFFFCPFLPYLRSTQIAINKIYQYINPRND